MTDYTQKQIETMFYDLCQTLGNHLPMLTFRVSDDIGEWYRQEQEKRHD